MTPTQNAEKLGRQLNELVTFNRPFALGVTAAHSMMTERIFTFGQDSSNGSIGNYSTKGIYINPKKAAVRNSKGFTGEGKTGKSKFEDGRSHVSTYFEGWKGFRSEQGLETDKVNLNYVGDLKLDFERPAKKIDVNLYEVTLDRDINNKKARGNEDHFGKVIFTPSQREVNELLRVTEIQLQLLFQ